MAVLSLSGAHLAYGHVALLDDAALSLEAGERLGLIGRNGAGKSSLLRVIAGLEKLDDGLLLIGLDVIGEQLTEINVTSPTCFQEIADQAGFDVAAMFIDALEAALRVS